MGNRKARSGQFEVTLAALLLLGIAFGTSASAQEAGPVITAEILETEDTENKNLVSDKILKQLEDIVRRADLNARAKTSFERDNFAFGGYWERRMEASYRMGNTTLIDDYGLVASITPEVLKYTSGKWGIGLGAKGLVRFQFARQHEGNRLADLARFAVSAPYTPWEHFPMSAQKALNKLKLYDFVSLQAHMSIMLTGSQLESAMVASTIPVNPHFHYMITGEFQVHIQRLENNKFRLRIFAIQEKNVGGGLSVGYNPEPDLQIVRLEFADKILRRRLKFSPFELNFNYPKSNLFMLDYVVDMTAPDTQQAYDDLIQSAWTTKTLKILNPFNSREELRELLLADVTRFEELFEREKDKSTPVVERMFRGENDVLNSDGLNFAIGHRDLGQLRHNQVHTENFITMVDRAGAKRYFYMPVFSIIDHKRALGGLWDEELLRTANMLFEANAEKEFNNYGDISFNLEYRDKKFEYDEVEELREFIRSRIPPELYAQIDWRDWNEKRNRTNARVTSLLVFRPNALFFVENMSAAEIYTSFVEYLKSLKEIRANPTVQFSDYERTSSPFVDMKYYEDLNTISYGMAKALDGSKTPKERADAFIHLRMNPLWQETGSGYLVHILRMRAFERAGSRGIQDVLDNMYFETTWEARDSDTVHAAFGSCRNRRLYKAVMYMYSVLHNRSIDLRLIDDNDLPGLPEKDKDPACE